MAWAPYTRKPVSLSFRIVSSNELGSVVQYEGRIAIFSTFVKLAVDRYNLRLRFGIYKLKFLRSIVGSRSVVSQLFD